MDKSNSTDLDPKWGEPDPFHDPYILANFKARETDVLITTAPKAGTTWMQQILHQLKTGGDDSFENIDDVVPWLERQHANYSWQERLDLLEKYTNPRVFKTHCTYEQTPGIDIAKIVLSSRDPRDCCVSFYHHTMNLTDEAVELIGFKKPESLDAYFETWLNAGVWYRNVKSWWPYKDKENILWLRYEDMKQDLPGTIDTILQFLGWSLNPEQRENVLHYISFDYMKKHSEKFAARNKNNESFFKPDTFIRKGEVGDHQDHLSKEQEEIILQKAHEELEPDCLKFLSL